MTNNYQLNTEQLEAVNHIDGPLVCLAGPGTGKTQIIAMRIANLLKETQMNPQNILCLTFTESGTVAMRKRLIEIIGHEAYQVKIFTFHGFCNEIISEYPQKFPFKREAHALDDVEKIEIYNSIFDGLTQESPFWHFYDRYQFRRDVTDAVQKLKKENISLEKFSQIINEEKSFYDKHSEKIQLFVSQNARSLNEQDFDTLLLEIPELKIFFQKYDLTDSKQRTALKSDIKKYSENLASDIPKHFEIARIYQSYEQKLKERARYDYEDMILKVIEQLKSDRELLSIYQERFQYILVDEYQDTNGAQNEVVELIGSFFDSPNIFVVGDDKQSIYKFQGASLENILYFYNRYSSTVKLIKLKENYRSTQNILDSASGLISKNESRIENFIPNINQELHSQKGSGNKIKLYEFESEQTENFFLAKKIKELISSGIDPKEIAVLYRKNRDAKDLIDLFDRLGVPFQVTSGDDILRDKKILKLLNVLRSVNDLGNSELLMKILFYDFFSFKKIDLAKLSINNHSRKKTLFSLISNPEDLSKCELSEPEKFYEFAEKLASWKSLDSNKIFTQTFDIILKESGFLNQILSMPESVENLNRINSLFEQVKDLNEKDHNFNLQKFISYIDILIKNEISIKDKILETKKNAVRLMTAHKSKGLEFEHVFIIKCYDKHWGNPRTMNKIRLPRGILKTESQSAEEVNEEERRLFYVALTRAKTELHLSYPKTNNEGKELVPSMFINEINPDLIEKISTEEIENEALERLRTIFLEPIPKDNNQDLEDYLHTLLDDYQLNVSHLNNYLQCPKIFYYKNLLLVPSAKDKTQSLGTAVHKTFQDLVKNREPSSLLQNFEKHLKDEIINEDDFIETLEHGKKIISAYWSHYSQTFNFNSEVEYNFKKKHVIFEGVPITGQIDKIEIINPEKKLVNIVDYKTGNPKSSKLKRGEDYWRQIVFYKILCDNCEFFPYKMVSGEVDFVQKDKESEEFKKIPVYIEKEDLEILSAQIKDSYQEIKSLAFMKFQPDRYCGECEWCLL